VSDNEKVLLCFQIENNVTVFNVYRLQTFASLEMNASQRGLAMLNLEAVAALSVPSQWWIQYVQNFDFITP